MPREMFPLASLSWPWEPLEPSEDDEDGPWAEQDKTPTERQYDEMNVRIEHREEPLG
jgi:hypothetical protein